MGLHPRPTVSTQGGESMSVTYYVALPFIEDDDGELQPGEALEAQTAWPQLGALQRWHRSMPAPSHSPAPEIPA